MDVYVYTHCSGCGPVFHLRKMTLLNHICHTWHKDLKFRVKVEFYLNLVGCMEKEKKGHLGVLLFHWFILVLAFLFCFVFLYFLIFPVSLIYSLGACGSWCCICTHLSDMTFGHRLHQVSLQISDYLLTSS